MDNINERDKNNPEDFVDENDNKIDDREEATLAMNEVDSFDFERANMLMGVMEKVANIAPKSSSISGLAAAALNEMNEEAKAIAKRRADEFKKLESQRAEALVAQQRERDESERLKAEQDAEDKRLRMHPKEPVAPEPTAPVVPRAIPANRPAPAPTNTTERRV